MRCCLLIALLVACADPGTRSVPPDVDQMSKACISAAACLPNQTIALCMDEAHLLQFHVSIYRPEQIRCLAGAGADCTRARACIGLTESPCSTPGRHCEGTVVHACFDGIDYAQQCSGADWYQPEATCVVSAQADCGLAACTTPNGPGMCVGDHLQRCSPLYELDDFDCSLMQQTCITDANGARCGTVGLSCTQPSTAYCDGNEFVSCDSAGQQTRYPSCETLLTGSICGAGNGPCGFGTLCDLLAPSSCLDGDQVRLCALGLPKTYSCAKLGYSGCSNGECVP